MENAAKALLITGEVLIGVIILSIMVIVFLRFGEISETLNAKIDRQRTVMFNTQYVVYQTNKDKPYISAQDVVTLVNKVESWNKEADISEQITLKVDETEIKVEGTNVTTTIFTKEKLTDYISYYNKYDEVFEQKIAIDSIKFTCDIGYKDGRVRNIKISTVE